MSILEKKQQNSTFATYMATRKPGPDFTPEEWADPSVEQEVFTDIGNAIGAYFEAAVYLALSGDVSENLTGIHAKAYRTFHGDPSGLKYKYKNNKGEWRIVTPEIVKNFRKIYEKRVKQIAKNAEEYAQEFKQDLLKSGERLKNVAFTNVTAKGGDLALVIINDLTKIITERSFTLELKATSRPQHSQIKYVTTTDKSLWGEANHPIHNQSIIGAYGAYVIGKAGHQIPDPPTFTDLFMGGYYESFLKQQGTPQTLIQFILQKSNTPIINTKDFSDKTIVYTAAKATSKRAKSTITVNVGDLMEILANSSEGRIEMEVKEGVAKFFSAQSIKKEALATLALEDSAGGTKNIPVDNAYFKAMLTLRLLKSNI